MNHPTTLKRSPSCWSKTTKTCATAARRRWSWPASRCRPLAASKRRASPVRPGAPLVLLCDVMLPGMHATQLAARGAFTSPLKLFEYMGAGCAIVAADLPSVREVLPATMPGWFVPGDPASLGAALRRLVEQPDLARNEGAQMRKAAALYTWEARTQSLIGFIEQVRGTLRRQSMEADK
jgi:hypothetical protein